MTAPADQPTESPDAAERIALLRLHLEKRCSSAPAEVAELFGHIERLTSLAEQAERERDEYDGHWSKALRDHTYLMNGLLEALSLDIDEDGEYIDDQIITAARVQCERLQAAERREAGVRVEMQHRLRQERERRESLERRHRNLIEGQKHYGESRVDMERRLDALLWVWCSGGCQDGILRWVDLSEYDNRRVAISEEVIEHAIQNMKRLVTKFRNLHFRPFYEGYLAAGHPWRKAVEMASAELDRLYPSTLAAPDRADMEGTKSE